MRELEGSARGEIETLENITKQLDADLDFLVWELRPTALDDLGLVEALTDYVATWSKYFGLQAQLHTRGMQSRRLASQIEIMLYRVAQEALNNVAKHAAAKRVELILEQRSDHVSLIIEDDGIGFDPDAVGENAKGLGLTGMRERAAFAGGTAAVESRPDAGTTVFVRIPT
jgi:signal transduction histidine kinase